MLGESYDHRVDIWRSRWVDSSSHSSAPAAAPSAAAPSAAAPLPTPSGAEPSKTSVGAFFDEISGAEEQSGSF